MPSIVWDDSSTTHIGRHQIRPDEVEEIFAGRPHVRRLRDERLGAYGQTARGRYVLVVFRWVTTHRVRVITARELSSRERHALKRRMKR